MSAAATPSTAPPRKASVGKGGRRARAPQPRQYRLPLPPPRECICGCAVFQPMRDDQLYRTAACRQAVSAFRKRRRANYLKRQGRG